MLKCVVESTKNVSANFWNSERLLNRAKSQVKKSTNKKHYIFSSKDWWAPWGQELNHIPFASVLLTLGFSTACFNEWEQISICVLLEHQSNKTPSVNLSYHKIFQFCIPTNKENSVLDIFQRKCYEPPPPPKKRKKELKYILLPEIFF